MSQLTVLKQETAIAAPLTANDIVAQVRLIQEVMTAVMREGEHYGKIPGCGDKPTLLQPGAQKLLMTFRLAPEYEVFQTDMEEGHREYRVQCTLKSIASGNFCGTGVGCCSTMEGKYRFRVAPKKATDRPVPKEYWDCWKTDPKRAQEILGGKGFSRTKVDGAWMISEGTDDKVEHDNPADYYNTVLKMAKKRALVDATLTATAASDIFTQDIEDMPEVVPGAAQPAPEPQATNTPPAQEKPAARPATTQAAPAGETFKEEVIFDDFKEVRSKPDAPKAWVGWFCNFIRDDKSEFEAGTFSQTISKSFEVLKGSRVSLVYKPGRKANQFEIVSIEPADDVPMQ